MRTASVLLVLCALVTASPADACKVALRWHAVRSSFAVEFQHEQTPVAGAQVSVTPLNGSLPAYRTVTGSNGRVEIAGLPPGRYGLSISYQGFIAQGPSRIEIKGRHALFASTRLQFRWPQPEISVPAAAGSATGVDGPVLLRLMDMESGSIIDANANALGSFSFAPVMPGLYLLRAQSGDSEIQHAIRIKPQASGSLLRIAFHEGACGSQLLQHQANP